MRTVTPAITEYVNSAMAVSVVAVPASAAAPEGRP